MHKKYLHLTRAFRSYLLFFSFSLLCCVFALAGNSRSVVPDTADSLRLTAINNRIEVLESNGIKDSLVYFYRLKANWYQAFDDLGGWLDTYWDLQYNYMGQPDSAIAYLREGLGGQWRSASTSIESESLCWMYVNLGYHQFRADNITGAVEAYEFADRIFTTYQFEDFSIVGYVYKPLGACYTMLGDNERARSVYQKALAIALPEGDPDDLGGLYNNIGLTYWNENDNLSAIDFYQKGLLLANLPPDKNGLLKSGAARSYLEQGNLQEAAKLAHAAIQLLQGLEFSDTARIAQYLTNAYLVQGSVLRRSKQFKPALAAFGNGLVQADIAFGTRYHRYSAKLYIELGQLYFQMDSFSLALQHYNLALSCVIPDFDPAQLQDIPSENYLQAENAIFEALEGKADVLEARYDLTGDLSDLEWALACHNLAYLAELKLWDVLQNESAKLLLGAYSRSRTEKVVRICHYLAQHTGEERYLEQAFLAVEQSRAQLLIDAVRENLMRRQLQTTDTLWQKEMRLRRELSYYTKEYQLAQGEVEKNKFLVLKNEIAAQINNLHTILLADYPQYGSIIQESTLRYSDLVDAADVNDTDWLIEYFFGEDYAYAFVIKHTNQSPELYRIGKTEEVEAQVMDLLGYFQSRKLLSNDREGYLLKAFLLHQKLLGPILDEESVPQNILIIPEGVLNFLPFEALVTQSDNTAWQRVPFLIRSFNIKYAYSAQILKLWTGQIAKGKKNLLAVAPVFQDGDRGLAPLLSSRQEIRRLSISGAEELTAEKATTKNLIRMTPNYRILHLSTHAQSAGPSPRLELYDRPLYLPEIYTLDLQADLVVLSACETGLGQVQQGEGVMSLSRGFAYAGGKSLVAGLWQVNETSTAQLFSDFYESLENGNSKSHALQNAKLKYLQNDAIPDFQKSPYYWAGFVYYGDGGAVTFTTFSKWYVVAFVFMLIGIGIVLGRNWLS